MSDLGAPAAPDLTANVSRETSAPPKRGRGRPPGAKNRVQRPAPATVTAAAADAAATALEREARKGRPTVKAGESATLQQGLQAFYVGAGAMIAVLGRMVGNARMVSGGEAAVKAGPECATALVAWSESNAQVRRALETLTTAGGASLVLAAHAPIAAAIWHPEPVAYDSPEVGSVDTAQGVDLGALVDLFT